MYVIKLQGDVEKRTGIYYEYDAESTPLGEGGMGRVFKGFKVVERTGERTPVAIKAIYDNIPERVVERARREANIQLDNDNLIRMFGFVETTSNIEGTGKSKVHYHVVMELLVGVTLENVINGITSDQTGMQIPYAAEIYSQYIQNRYATVVRIMKPILSGLMALHDNGFIHRDIDPSNIMLTIDGKIKLIDFGICKQIVSLGSLDKALTATGVFMGKVNYAAPELVLGDVKSQNYTTDIYALGVLLFQLCTGHLPFSGTDQEILSANLRKPLPLKEIQNNNYKRIIRKATEKEQAKRYASVAELRVYLERISTNGGKNSFGWTKIAVIGGAVVVAIATTVLICVKHLPDDQPIEDKTIIAQQPTCEEIYSEALSLLGQTDSIQLQIRGKEMLKALVEDSLYAPAQQRYYVVLLNSKSPEEVKRGFSELEKIASSDTLNAEVLFECGLTLSKSNKVFNVPTVRQSFLGIKPDLTKANEYLYSAMRLDDSDYKSVYWAFNNLMEMKLDGSLPSNGDNKIVELYRLFENRILNHDDNTAEIYKKAIISDKETLKAWGLIN